MKKIKDYSRLRKSVELYNKGPFNKIREIVFRVLSAFVIVGCGTIIIPPVINFFYGEYNGKLNLLIFLDLLIANICQLPIYKINKNYINREYMDSNDYLDQMADLLDKEYKIKVSKEDISKSVITTEREKVTSINYVVDNELKGIIRTSTFFILDKENKIRVLKEIEKKIKGKNKLNVQGSSILYYVDDYDLSNAPVEKRLVLKK